MSYDIDLKDREGNLVTVDNLAEGGTYVIGGSTDASLNITYNYSGFYYEHLDKKWGIRWIYGKKGKQVIRRLEKAIAILGTQRDTDYWKSTPGNAGFALSILLKWATQYPEAIFSGD